MELTHLIARLCCLYAVVPINSLDVWRVLVAHPWVHTCAALLAVRLVQARDLSYRIVQDLVQEALTELSHRDLTRLDLSRSEAEIAAYLRRVINWEVHAAWRRLYRPSLACSLDQVAEPTTLEDDAGDVWDLLSHLPDRQRAIVTLRIAGHQWAEISELVHLPLATAYGQYKAARQTVAEALAR